MKTVILCGGFGTRLSEETHIRPKPMVEVGGKPILWHIMKLYAHYGFNDFSLALGYKGEHIKNYFLNYHPHNSDITIDLSTGKAAYENSSIEDWSVYLKDTGKESQTGGRLHRLQPQLEQGGTFMLTYGDGVANLDIEKLVKFHRSHGKIATVTSVRPPARFGTMTFDGDQVVNFSEKPQTGEGWINGGFFVFEPEIFKYLSGDQTILEREPLENLAKDRQLMAYKHEGFWHPMDMLRDRNFLHGLCEKDEAPWMLWEKAHNKELETV
jgi:glucose-1-phosphate cytidylyltransferase